MKTSNLIKFSILSGIFISIGGWAYLAIGGIVGMIFFTFGLLAVVHFGTTLYTGTAGFDFTEGGKWWKLPLILLFNVIGCIIMGFITRCSSLELMDAAEKIVQIRMNNGFFNSLGLGVNTQVNNTQDTNNNGRRRYAKCLSFLIFLSILHSLYSFIMI